MKYKIHIPDLVEVEQKKYNELVLEICKEVIEKTGASKGQFIQWLKEWRASEIYYPCHYSLLNGKEIFRDPYYAQNSNNDFIIIDDREIDIFNVVDSLRYSSQSFRSAINMLQKHIPISFYEEEQDMLLFFARELMEHCKVSKRSLINWIKRWNLNETFPCIKNPLYGWMIYSDIRSHLDDSNTSIIYISRYGRKTIYHALRLIQDSKANYWETIQLLEERL
jgi:hypothetical protein